MKRYVWWHGRVWIHTGIVYASGMADLRYTDRDLDSSGYGMVAPDKDCIPVTGDRLLACIRCWGPERHADGLSVPMEIVEYEPCRKVLAIDPVVRTQWCDHPHIAWSGRMPCTGMLVCSMCGTAFHSAYAIPEARRAVQLLVAQERAFAAREETD